MDVADRITSSPNGQPKAKRKRTDAQRRAGEKAAATRQRNKELAKQAAAQKANKSRLWAWVGLVLTLFLSAGLNGYTNALHADLQVAGWALGVTIPVIVFCLFQVAIVATHRSVTCLAVLSGMALLGLSVHHCAEAISLLTGSSVMLAAPMAVAIDFGIVSFEAALYTEQ